MSTASGLDYLGIDSATVVLYQKTQMTWAILQYNLHSFRLRVTEGIHQGFPPDPVNLIASRCAQRLTSALNSNLRSNFLLRIEFMQDSRKGVIQIHFANIGGAEPRYDVSAFSNAVCHDL